MRMNINFDARLILGLLQHQLNKTSRYLPATVGDKEIWTIAFSFIIAVDLDIVVNAFG